MIVFRADAEADINTVWDWYEKRQPGLGCVFRDRLDKVVERIASFPLLYAVACDDIRIAPIKRFPFAVYYRVISDKVIVTAVLHHSRDPRIWQSRF